VKTVLQVKKFMISSKMDNDIVMPRHPFPLLMDYWIKRVDSRHPGGSRNEGLPIKYGLLYFLFQNYFAFIIKFSF
jgi:hypothetical protein